MGYFIKYIILLINWLSSWSIIFSIHSYSIKLTILISLVLLMRGGTPRYRYDYLTKLGWIKFLSYSLCIISIIILLYFIF